jgi:hypothetical protein
MIDSFIKSGLNMIVLYVRSQPNSLCSNFWSNMYKCITIYQSFNIIKNNSLYDLLQSIDDTMFHNPFVDQYRFHIIILVSMKMMRR